MAWQVAWDGPFICRPTRWQLGVGVLGAVMIYQALQLVGVRQALRQRFVELQTLEQTYQATQIEYSKLLLEHSTWATKARVEQVAREQLGLVAPTTIQRMEI